MRQKTKSVGKLASLFLTAMLFVFLVSVPAAAAVPDRPENLYVLDSAGVLSEETEKEIIQQNEKLFEKTGAQIAVAAVDFLGGEDITDYTYEMFNSWGVGSSQRNNGILLVLAIGEDNYYAQAGYGIDTYFDGAKLKELLNSKLETDFAAGDYDAGVKKFFAAVYSEMESYYANYSDEYTQQNGQNQGGTVDESEFTVRPHSGIGSWISRIIGIIFRILVIVIVIVVFTAILRGIGGGRGGPRGGGGGGGGFWTGMFLGNMMGGRRNRWRGPPPGGFGGPRPPRGGGGFGGFTGGGHSGGGGFGRGGGFGGGGGFSGGGGSHGGGAGRG